MEKAPRAQVSAQLCTGRTITLQEPTGEDELKAQLEAGNRDDSPVLIDRALIMRSIVDVDGEPLDLSSVSAATIRDYFSGKEWVQVRTLFQEFFITSEEEEKAFSESKRLTSA